MNQETYKLLFLKEAVSSQALPSYYYSHLLLFV